MATHVNIPPTGSGDAGPIPVATTDDGSGNKHQQVVTEFLTAGVPTAVDATHQLPVTAVVTGTPAISGTVTANIGTSGSLALDSSTQSVLTGIGTPSDAAATTTGSAIAQLRRIANELATIQTNLGAAPMQQTGGTVTVTGTVTANAGSGTLAVSASALPLPSGAATAAKQPALGTAGTPATDVITVQGNASGTPIPVSGTFSASGTTDLTASGTITTSGQAVSITTLNGMSSVIVDLSGTVAGITLNTQGTVDGTNWFQCDAGIDVTAVGSTSGVIDQTGQLSALGRRLISVSGYSGFRIHAFSGSTTGAVIALRATAAPGGVVITKSLPEGANTIGNAGIVDASGVGGAAVTSQALNTNLALLNGAVPSASNGTSGAGTQRVTIASDSTGQVKLAAGSAAVGSVTQLDLATTASITASAQAATLNLNGQGTLQIDCQGTFSATLNVEASVDGTTFIAIPRGLTPTVVTGIPASGTTFTTPVNVFVACAGFSAVRVRCSAYVSGTAVLTLRATMATGIVALGQALPVGTNVIGALTANQSVNTAQINGVAPLMGNGVTGTGAMRVSIASDSTGQMAIAPRTTGGYTVSRLISAATTNATLVKNAAGQVYGWSLTNSALYAVFLKIYNKAIAPTVGTDTPFLTIGVAAGASVNAEYAAGIPLGTGIAFAITKLVADTDTTVVVLNDLIVNLVYL